MSEPIIACHGLAKQFVDGQRTIDVLRDVNLSIDVGQRIAIVGPSGSGKSTLLHLLGGLDKPSAGQVLVAGQEINHVAEHTRCQLRNQKLGFVYQFHHLLPEFTALENVAMPLLVRGVAVPLAKQKAMDMLTRVGLHERVDHKPGQLSGGERQRTAIARALITQPSCVLADEPTGNLDQETAQRVYTNMLELNQHLGTSILIVTHDLTLAQRMDTIWVLDDGCLTERSK